MVFRWISKMNDRWCEWNRYFYGLEKHHFLHILLLWPIKVNPYIMIILFTLPKKGCNKKCIETIIEAAGALMAHREKCIRQHVLIVKKNVKFPLNRMGPNQYIVGTVIRNIGQRDFNTLFFFIYISSVIRGFLQSHNHDERL